VRFPPKKHGRRPNPAAPVGHPGGGGPLGPGRGMLCWPVVGQAPQPPVAVRATAASRQAILPSWWSGTGPRVASSQPGRAVAWEPKRRVLNF
jgi:hypothetical protein